MEWLLTEKEHFDSDLDKNKDGFLDEADRLEKLDEDDLEFLRQNLFIRPKLELNGKFTLLFFIST